MKPAKYILSGSLLILLLSLFTANPLQAQCDQAAATCETELLEYLTDGQYYRVQVVKGEEASLKVTMFEGFRYRIVACTEASGANIKYEMYDGSMAKVFSNEDVADGTGWDFEIGATDEFTIKASLESGELGCIVFEIGYDDEMFMEVDDWGLDDDPFFEDELEDELDYGDDVTP